MLITLIRLYGMVLPLCPIRKDTSSPGRPQLEGIQSRKREREYKHRSIPVIFKDNANLQILEMQCLFWCGLSCCGASAVIQTQKRQEMREKYNIDGSVVEDCLGAFFCRGCGLIQEEKEVMLRQQNGSAAGYQVPQGMDYKP